MKKSTIVALATLGVVILIAVMATIYCVGIHNTEIELANRYDAQFNVVETTLDKMRKTLMNQFKVNQKFADDFIKVVAMQAEGRAGGGAIKLNLESANKLGIESALYMKMMNSIEGQLAEFKRSQDVLTDVWMTHKTYCQRFPNALMVGGKIKDKPEMISSGATKEAMRTKRLDDDLLGG